MIKNIKQLPSSCKNRIIITPGEPSGIGPDITIMAIQKKWPVELVVCADSNLLLNRAKKINLPLKLRPYDVNQMLLCTPGEASILNIPVSQTVIPGILNIKNNNYVINTLKQASKKCINKEFAALITGPVNKSVINQGGILFTGHTEFLAKINQCQKTIMMLSNKKLKVALVTTHIPISSVSKSITQQAISDTIKILMHGLQKYFNILRPNIYVCGLNPHAGESGFIGREEIEVIIPTLNFLRKKINCNIIGPLPADTIFQSKYLNNADVILAMYHDQGLSVLKYVGFNQSVNITFGLPFIRTSVDHGSALELSGTGKAIPNSMIAAITTSINMIKNL